MLHIIARCLPSTQSHNMCGTFCAPKRANFSHDRRCPGQRQIWQRRSSGRVRLFTQISTCCASISRVACSHNPTLVGCTQPRRAAKILYSDKHIEATHRLDKLASGCLLLARTPRAKSRLAEQFAAEAIHKNYLLS